MAIFDRERYLDRRTYKRHIKRGTLTEAQYKQYVADLPDMTDNIMDKEEGGDDDGYEARVEAAAQEGQQEEDAAAEPPAEPANPGSSSGYGV